MSIQNLLVYIGYAFVGLVFIYFYCYLIAAPRVLKGPDRKKLSESYLQFGNILLCEHELKELAAEGNESAQLLMRVINAIKWLFLLLTILLIILIGKLVMSL
jgi:hypothetical protein